MAARLRAPHARGRAAAVRGGAGARRRGLAADPVGDARRRWACSPWRSACCSRATSSSSTASCSAGRSCSASGGRSAEGPAGLLLPVGACALALLLALPVAAAGARPRGEHRLPARARPHADHVQLPGRAAGRPRGVGPLDALGDPRRPAGAAPPRDERAARPAARAAGARALAPRARPRGRSLRERLLAAVLFSTNARPFSSALLAAIPPLGSFRVPTRALLPLALALPVVALAAATTRAGRWLRLRHRDRVRRARSCCSCCRACRARSPAGRSRSPSSCRASSGGSSRGCRRPASCARWRRAAWGRSGSGCSRSPSPGGSWRTPGASGTR